MEMPNSMYRLAALGLLLGAIVEVTRLHEWNRSGKLF